MRRGKRGDPNSSIGGIPIPGTGIILIPNPDYNGFTPDNDISIDPQICNELEQIPFSGVDCSGNGKQFFKYIVEKELCEECITKILVPMNLPLSRICYKIRQEDCDLPKEEQPNRDANKYVPPGIPDWFNEEKQKAVDKKLNPPELSNTYYKLPYGYYTVYIDIYTGSEFSSQISEKGYYSNSSNTSSTGGKDYEFTAPGSYIGSVVIEKVLAPFYIKTTNHFNYFDGWSGLRAYATDLIDFSGKTTYIRDSYYWIGYSWGAEDGIFPPRKEAFRLHVDNPTLFLVSKAEPLILDNSKPPNTKRKDREEPLMDCCTCADIRLMLERQKKDIFKYIDERKIDYVKILNMINQLGVNLTQVNFDFSKQLCEYNEVNFHGLAANIAIINQTIVDISNAILTNNNENTLFLSLKFDDICAKITIENLKIQVAIRNSIQSSLVLLRNELVTTITANAFVIEKNITLAITNSTNKVILDLSKDIYNLGATLTAHITTESNLLFIDISTEIGNLVVSNINLAIKTIIAEIRKNRQIITTSLFNFSKNLNEYLAILLLQLSTEIKFAVGDIVNQLKINPNIFTNLVNNILGGIGALIVPIINNSFDTKFNPVINLISNNNQQFNEKFDNLYNEIVTNYTTINNILNDVSFDIQACTEKDYLSNFNLIIALLNNLGNSFNNQITDLESFLNVKFSNLKIDFDYQGLELLINNSSQDIKNSIKAEIREKCQSFNTALCDELKLLIGSFNQNINNSLNQIISSLDQNNIDNNTVTMQLQSISNQINQIQTFNNQLLSNIQNLSQKTDNNFSNVINTLSQITTFLQQELNRLSNEGKQNVIDIQGGTGLSLRLVMEILLTILALLTGIDKIIKDNENCCDTVKDIENRSKEISDKLTEIEKQLKDAFPELKGTVTVKCGTDSLNYIYDGKGLLGISQQILSIVEISKLLLNAICVDSIGSFNIECEDLPNKKLTEFYAGNGIIGLREEIKAFADLQSKFNKFLCEREDSCPSVLYPSEQHDHKPIQTQLQIYFGYNYPKATGTLTPLYIPNPRPGLIWDDFDQLIRSMGQEYVRIQWDDNPLIGSGLWGSSESHLEDIGNRIIALSTEEATLRFTKGGKRKRPIIERELRAVRAVISTIDENGKVTNTICLKPPKK